MPHAYVEVPQSDAPPVLQAVPKEMPRAPINYAPVAPDQARVIAHLPPDAELFVDEHLINLSSKMRCFDTPSLKKARDFQYTMKVEYVRDGKTYTDKQVVKLRAGETSVVEFDDLTTATTVLSTINVIAPDNAKIIVENQQVLPAGVKEYRTPKLAYGMKFAYSFRAEITTNGKPQSVTQEVIFKAGEPVTVNFSDSDTRLTASK